MKLKKGDEIQVAKGKDKGKKGKIEEVFSKEKKVFVPGVNEYKRHLKARSKTQKAEIVTIAKPLPEANVRLICPKCHQMTRVGYQVDKSKEGRESRKRRICKKCDSVI